MGKERMIVVALLQRLAQTPCAFLKNCRSQARRGVSNALWFSFQRFYADTQQIPSLPYAGSVSQKDASRWYFHIAEHQQLTGCSTRFERIAGRYDEQRWRVSRRNRGAS